MDDDLFARGATIPRGDLLRLGYGANRALYSCGDGRGLVGVAPSYTSDNAPPLHIVFGFGHRRAGRAAAHSQPARRLVLLRGWRLRGRLLAKCEASDNEKALALATSTSPVAWRHVHLNGRYVFRDAGQAIDLDAIIQGLKLE